MQLVSSDFESGGVIPTVSTYDGDNMSPYLHISDVVPGTESLVLIMEDVDAPGGAPFTHWLLYDIAPTTSELPAGAPPLSPGKMGQNDFGDIGYGGPHQPPSTHRYVFTLYALDTVLMLPDGATRQHVQQAMDGFVIATAQLVGTYTKEK